MPHEGHDHPHTHHHDHKGDARHYRHASAWAGSGGTRRAFIVGAVLNSILVIGEYVAGWWSGSLSLVADASHNLTDVLGLLLAFIAIRMAARLPTARYTYGLGSCTILAALLNGLLLVFISGALAWQSVERLQHPQPVVGDVVIIVALLGAVVNGVTAKFFHGHNHGDVNVRGVYIHMLGDMGISLAVALGALAVKWTGEFWIDPALSLLIVLAIVAGSWGVLREAAELALQGVPSNISLPDVRSYLEEQPGVAVAHDLHIWGLSTTETALTAHLVMPEGHPGDAFLERVTQALVDRFGIVHATLQVETSPHHMHCPPAAE